MSSSMFKAKGAKIRQWNSDLQRVLSNKESCRKVEVAILHHRMDPGNTYANASVPPRAEMNLVQIDLMVEIPWCSA